MIILLLLVLLLLLLQAAASKRKTVTPMAPTAREYLMTDSPYPSHLGGIWTFRGMDDTSRRIGLFIAQEQQWASNGHPFWVGRAHLRWSQAWSNRTGVPAHLRRTSKGPPGLDCRSPR